MYVIFLVRFRAVSFAVCLLRVVSRVVLEIPQRVIIYLSYLPIMRYFINHAHSSTWKSRTGGMERGVFGEIFPEVMIALNSF